MPGEQTLTSLFDPFLKFSRGPLSLLLKLMPSRRQALKVPFRLVRAIQKKSYGAIDLTQRQRWEVLANSFG